VRGPTDWISAEESPLRRVAEAKQKKQAEVERMFADAGVAFPPAEMLLRAFKRERILELWAASRPGERLARVATYGICYLSGGLGPKRREGDLQVPEGFYKLIDLNPTTPFYLALHVGYPNESDRILGDRRRPGGEILIHGACVSVGCLAMSDERAAELWIAASAVRFAGRPVHVHIFPTRDLAGLLASPEGAAHRAFWENLVPGFSHFEESRRIPRIRVNADGRYEIAG
jgi:murein L,D-transpeptidase YafK